MSLYPSGSAAATILVVDDDRSVAHVQRWRLERAGYRVIVAGTYDEALALALRGDCNLAIVDYCLDLNQTGLELFEQFKARGVTLPVILVTGHSDERTVIRALRAGVSDFVPKTAAYLEYLPEAVARVLRQTRIERQLADSEARFASFMDHSPAICYIKDEHMRLLFLSRPGIELFDLADYQGKTVFDVLPEDVARRIHENETRVLRENRAQESLNAAALPNGELRHWLSFCFPMNDANGRPMLGGVSLDITPRVEAEKALRSSEARFRSVSESALEAIMAIDQYGQVVSWNPAATRMFGYTIEEMLGSPIERIIPQRYLAAHREAMVRRLAGSAGPLQLHPRQLFGMRKDGSEFPLELSIGQWTSGDETFYSGIVRDLTERHRVAAELALRDEQLRHAQQLEALGTLAGGVAHEFNNLLQTIQGYARYAAEGLDSDDRRAQDLELVLTAAERGASLTRQLLTFGRRQTLEYTDLEANRIVRDAAHMLRPLIGAHIELQLDLQEDAGLIHADPMQLQQLLVNLCINARDAMPQGGQILVRTEHALQTECDCPDSKLSQGRYLRLTVADTGCGMPPEVLSRAFEPFFTTKDVGKGTGLGLSTVYGIVAQHKGCVRVQSSPGKGTTFVIMLPTVTSIADNAPRPRPAPRAAQGELILVAEDEPLIRDLAVRMLRSAGYRTVEAGDGAEAVELFQRYRGELALVLLDMIMPRLNGHDAYRQMRALEPRLKAIIASADNVEWTPPDDLPTGWLRFLAKPFDPDRLLSAVAELLDAPEPQVLASTPW